MKYGCNPSKLDGSEIILDDVLENMDIPKEYSYVIHLPNVYDQGNTFTCVPHAISAFVDWYNGINGINMDMSIDWIYNCRENKDNEGMSLKEALKYIKKDIFGREYIRGLWNSPLIIEDRISRIPIKNFNIIKRH